MTLTGIGGSVLARACCVGSFRVELAMKAPQLKPTPRITKVVPTPAKKMRAFDDMTVAPMMHKNARISAYVPDREK